MTESTSIACWMALRTRMSFSFGCPVFMPSHMYWSAPATRITVSGGGLLLQRTWVAGVIWVTSTSPASKAISAALSSSTAM